MKIIEFIIIFFLAIAFSSCDKMQWDLERDNPLDSENNVGGALTLLEFCNYVVVYDNNNNNIINAGETIYLKVFVVNKSNIFANAVTSTFSSSSPYLSQFSPVAPVNFGMIIPGDSAFGNTSYTPNFAEYYTIKFTVNLSTPPNITVPINLVISDQSGNKVADSFQIFVY
jgi:hypothetical protein